MPLSSLFRKAGPPGNIHEIYRVIVDQARQPRFYTDFGVPDTFEDMDVSLREMGAGDMGVGKRVKAMVQAFYGRIASYEAGLAGDQGALEAALLRNVYATVEPARENAADLAGYLRAQAAHMASLALEAVENGKFCFEGAE